MSHTSSYAARHFTLVNGRTSADAYVAACLNIGGDEGMGSPVPQFRLCDTDRREAHGRITWDAEHALNGSTSRFFSVAPVRLDVKASGECLLAVGTADFVRLNARPYRWVERVQVGAAAACGVPGRTFQWDLIELVFCYADGRAETYQSTCLPAVATEGRVRWAAQAPPQQRAELGGQYAEVFTGSRDVVGIRLRGQVTMRANEGAPASPLRAEDLQGRIAIFTDSSGGCG